ncbi:MAG: DUF488 family protein [Chromatiales bacterium]
MSATVHIRTKRIYEAPEPADGTRILVDRLWPRGISKATADIDYWARDVAPSDVLRRWYSHEPTKWDEFRGRYFAELDANPDGIAALRERLEGTVTFVFSSKETELNNAAALKAYLEDHSR